ncbi:MAG: phosphopentomutase [Magnetococcus sp. WYHC-3]
MKRAIIVVIDSLGIGAMDDAPHYGDGPWCNTLGNIDRHLGGLRLPHLGRMGLGNLLPLLGVPPEPQPAARCAVLKERSEGKDTTTGHWEMAGLVLEQPFRVYPQGFPESLMRRFAEATGCGGWLANCPASGTAIIDEFDARHRATGYPIIYTSADSVFQIAANVQRIPLETLYHWCETARALLTDAYNVSRVIARPYEATAQGLKRISAARRDYSVSPPAPTLLDQVLAAGGRVVGIGKIEDIFVGAGVSHAVHTGSNREGMELTLAAVQGRLDLPSLARPAVMPVVAPKCELIFTNLVDTDMLYGHRNDVAGYGRALEEIDAWLPELSSAMTREDLLVITADHGCDPTAPGTDHTREKVPLLLHAPGQAGGLLGEKDSFTHVAYQVAQWMELPVNPLWCV